MLEGLTPPRKVLTCAVRTQLNQLSDKDAAILVEALNNVALWPAKTLSRALKERDITLADNSISVHRRGACSCSKA